MTLFVIDSNPSSCFRLLKLYLMSQLLQLPSSCEVGFETKIMRKSGGAY
jgi:hypothetical protein